MVIYSTLVSTLETQQTVLFHNLCYDFSAPFSILLQAKSSALSSWQTVEVLHLRSGDHDMG